jgi:hypothetical protein
MKKVLITLVLLVLFTVTLISSRNNPIHKSDCTFKGIKLYGRVKVVTSFPDVKVQIVSSFPDLKVQAVKSFPDRCGKWEFVDTFPDFKIQFVTSFSDIKIQYVNSFPGAW